MSLALSASPYFLSPTVNSPGQVPVVRSSAPVNPADSASADKQFTSNPPTKSQASDEKRGQADAGNPESRTVNGQSLEESELAALEDLKARDREVRAHEAAHQSVGGQYAGAVSYTYSRGPDGVQYATGGEVPIDVAPVANNPQATIDKMRTVRAAALAPAEPSTQDRQVAAQAMQTMLQAQVELAAERRSPSEEDSSAPEESKEDRPNNRQRQQAETAYQGISSLNDPAPSANFQATA
ncbi:putative metalloprotease CJM1_0395 family protein [Marinobacter fonticola]|uniref:putative metalloprotease CJM1_0395 family protein n=1 Tax=Marinobacter fonticola TaxID=2603215 RepID=UPI0011E840F2|nr:putative metalloprotease CJM1_0395 family protein [Marinobacter fonticola]